MTPIARCREEQRLCRDWLEANGRDRGCELGLADWVMEEILIERENQRIMDSGSTEPE